MSDEKLVSDQVREEAAAIIQEGSRIRERIADVVAQGAEQAQQSGQGLIGLVQSVMDSAVSTLNQSLPQDPNSTLRQVIDGLSDGLSSAALAAKMAVHESVASSRAFAQEDLQKFSGDVSTLKEMYSQTVTDALGKLRNLTAEQLSDLQKHAVSAQSQVLPALQSAFEAAYQHPVTLGKESVQAGLEISRQTVGNLFSAVGRMLQETGNRLNQQQQEGQK